MVIERVGWHNRFRDIFVKFLCQVRDRVSKRFGWGNSSYSGAIDDAARLDDKG